MTRFADAEHSPVGMNSRARTYGIQPSGPTSDTTNFRAPSSFSLLIEGNKIEVSCKQEQATQNYSREKLAEPSDKMSDWKPTRPESMKDQASLCMAFQERELQEISFKRYEQNQISSKSYLRMSLLLF